MASKRKKFRPTKIAMVVESLEEEAENHFSLNKDPLTRIQRFIEEESEDTPDSCYHKIQWSPVRKTLSLSERAATADHSVSPDKNGFKNKQLSTAIGFTNGHVPDNLKFHRLAKEEEKAGGMTSPLIPGTKKDAICDGNRKGYSDKPLNGNIAKKSTFHQAIKKSSSKRIRACDEESPRYTCTTCNYETNRSDHYKRHLMTHSSDKPLKCTKCNYETGRSDHYKRHLQRHGMSVKDIIDTCSRNGLKLKSASLAALSDVNNRVDGLKEKFKEEKRYNCEVCGYSTDIRSHLNQHKICHVADNVFRCEKCNKSFKCAKYLRHHRCGKLSQRRCPECRIIFVDRPALLLHISNEHLQDELFLQIKANMKMRTQRNGTGKDKALKSLPVKRNAETEPEAGIDEPIDLTAGKNRKFSKKECTSEEDADATTNEGCDLDKNRHPVKEGEARFLPKMPSASDFTALGNLRCTKCGVWFNKLNQYSSHSCVS